MLWVLSPKSCEYGFLLSPADLWLANTRIKISPISESHSDSTQAQDANI